jgi:hypothetical protein
MSLIELNRPKSAAPGQYLGFSLQQLRFCDYLLWVPDDTSVSLEVADDIAVHRADGSTLLEQAKSAPTSNPVADRSDQLWKTFANWADRIEEGLDPSNTDFVLYVTPLKEGSLVRTLHAAISAESVATALAQVKALVNKRNAGVGCSPHVTKFLRLGDTTCSQVIARFTLVTEEDPAESIRARFRATLRAQSLEDFCITAIGMARDFADNLIRNNQPAMVSAAEFRKKFHAFVRKYDLLGLLPSNAPTPTSEVIATLVDTAPIFVRQLTAVEASTDMLVTAVSDFLRSEADKIMWADEGRILSNSLVELDAQLERQHILARDEIEDTLGAQNEMQRGRALYRKCAETNLPLEGNVLPSHFIPGAFNCLADMRRVGWHPNYKILFPAEEGGT